ncbi:carboxypeptidase M32 [Candidatus Woesearchaeota archaeon]|nr:carboxypeptidase M32 [Candidatus Woesearchaeota archaeon]
MNNNLVLIKNYQKEITILGQNLALLEWDQLTYMPPMGVNSRSEQISLLSNLIHKKMISNELFTSLTALKKQKLSNKDGLMVKKLYKEVSKSRKLPEKYIKELSKTTSLAYTAWELARKEKRFKKFQPYLEKIIKLKKQECNYINEPGHEYNSLLDQYEEGMTVEKLKSVFSKLKKDLINLLNKIKDSSNYKKQKNSMLKQHFSIEKQRNICEDVIKRMGLLNGFSRLDLTTHPFSQKIGIDDVRMATNFRESPLFSFESTMHEAGHALYEFNLPKEDAYNILGNAPSLGIHESQSIFWENMIGKQKYFWQFYFPLFKKEFNLKGDFNQWFKEVNYVKPGLVRIESDELTYCLHIILRFELELGLIEGSIKVLDLPNLWNKKMREFLGVTPNNDVNGVLQDVHWSGGSFGYFPTYAIGTIYSSQLYKQLLKERPFVEEKIRKGNFREIILWLDKNIYKPGNKLTAEEIIKKTCGDGLDPKVFIDYLTKKYSEIYEI